jgi:hypothetical protein
VPAFWNASPFPPIGPDRAPMVSPIPAEECYATIDGGEFMPEECYGP